MSEKSGKDTQENDNIEQHIDRGIELVSSVAGAALGLVTGEPISGVLIGAASGKGLEIALKKTKQEILARALSSREKVRALNALDVAVEEIRRRLENGESLREDNFFDEKQTGRSDAEEVAEHVLLKVQREPEEKKIQYMGHLLASISFDSQISVHMAHQLTKAAEQLTYRQLCILKLSVVKDNFELHDKDYRGQGTLAQELYPLLYEYMDLYRKDFIIFGIGFSSVSSLADINPGLADVQGIGVDLFNLMKLALIPDEDIIPIAAQLK